MTAAAQSFNGNLKKALAGIRRINLEGLRWRVFDAKGQVLGRLASQISTVIQGKDKPTYAPNRDDGDMCIVINAKDIGVTGRKLTDKFYRWHTGSQMPEKAFSSYPTTLGTKRELLSLGLQTNGFITWIANKWCCQVEDFFNWNRVKLRYCDGASFTGNSQNKGLQNNLPKTCTNHFVPTSCFFPQNLVANVKTPLFLLNAPYDAWQLQASLAPASAYPHGLLE